MYTFRVKFSHPSQEADKPYFRTLQLSAMLAQIGRSFSATPPRDIGLSGSSLDDIAFTCTTPETARLLDKAMGNRPERWDEESIRFLTSRGYFDELVAQETDDNCRVTRVFKRKDGLYVLRSDGDASPVYARTYQQAMALLGWISDNELAAMTVEEEERRDQALALAKIQRLIQILQG